MSAKDINAEERGVGGRKRERRKRYEWRRKRNEWKSDARKIRSK